jgi:hypothetical protein
VVLCMRVRRVTRFVFDFFADFKRAYSRLFRGPLGLSPTAGASRSGGAAGACELGRRRIQKRWPPSLPPPSAQPRQRATRPDTGIHIVLLCLSALSRRVRHGIEALPAWDLIFARVEYFEGTTPPHFLPLSTLYILEFRWEACLPIYTITIVLLFGQLVMPNQLEHELHVAQLHDLIELRLCI